MQFADYLAALSEHLGEHQLPLNRHWLKASGIVRADAVHYDVIKEVLQRVYRENRCTKPADPVRLEAIMDSLGEIHLQLSETDNPDIESLNLIHAIGEFSVDLFDESAAGGPQRQSGHWAAG